MNPAERATKTAVEQRGWRTAAWAITMEVLDDVLPLLASVWSDHRDYRPEWAPETVIPGS